MYTKVVRKKLPVSEKLGRFMLEWRKEKRLTADQAGATIGVSKSTWSNLERAQRGISVETLFALSEQTGRSVDSLMAMILDVRRSQTMEERALRVATMAERVPKAALLLDLLPELTDGEIDTLLSVAESLNRQGIDQKSDRRDGQ